jgi:hypothetical protein
LCAVFAHATTSPPKRIVMAAKKAQNSRIGVDNTEFDAAGKKPFI